METGWPDLQHRRGERGLEKMGEKRKEKREERERNRENEKNLIKMGQLNDFFYSMKSYNSFSFMKNYGNILTI